MKIVITQSNYIPWKGYFDALNMADQFVLFDDMQYTKRDWRNRNIIQTANGLKWLSIPVNVKGKYFQKINETAVTDQVWAEKHWNSFVHHYKKAPFFNNYESIVKAAYEKASKETFLSDINRLFIETIVSILGINTKIIDSRQFNLAEGKTERLLQICKELGGTHYLTGPAAKNYMNESLFQEESIQLEYLDYSNYPTYQQLFEPFEHGVTIFDLIFNTGPEVKSYMNSF